jgi:hypothetical protein
MNDETAKNLLLFPAHVCVSCDKWEKNEWIPEAMKELHEKQQCHNCNFWTRKISKYGIGFEKHFVVKGTIYLAHDSKSASKGGPVMRGFGGREHIILFCNNTTIVTTNLWCQGDVIERFRKFFPDNAAFVHVEDCKWEDLPLIKEGYWK